MRKPLIMGNWKMNLTCQEAVSLISELGELISDVKDVEISVCPSFTSLALVKAVLPKNMLLGAQNMHFEDSGAFTGEVSPSMIKETGCSFVILGHSERRHIFGEDSELVGKKVKSAQSVGLVPVLCVGETEEERNDDKAFEVIGEQLSKGLADASADVVIAYEPVWAIGTGKTASPDDAQEVHKFIRTVLSDVFGDSGTIRILYGGSVKSSNIKKLMAEEDIDGVLVGGASLKAKDFSKIVKF